MPRRFAAMSATVLTIAPRASSVPVCVCVSTDVAQRGLIDGDS